MSMIYDNWERLVAAVLKREEIWQLCHEHSRSPSICSESSDSSSSFLLSDVKLQKKEESVQETVPKLVFLGGSTHGFPLKGALKGAQELGKGTFGTSILTQLLQDVEVSDQELLATGTELVMKLLNEVKATEEEFKQQMMVFGNCRHENVAAPRAYYFSNKANRKLLFYNYHSQGSVSDMLHGNRSKPNWESRLRIAIGAARGIAHIHTQCGGKLAHGNMKSSNIFLNSQQYGCVSDFSLAGIMEKKPVLRGLEYHAAAHFRSESQELDVYNFGSLLLELLTGKSPMQAQGLEKDLELVTWVRSLEPHQWTSKLFDRSLMDENNLIEMVKTETPGVDLVTKDSVTDLEASTSIPSSHFHSIDRVPTFYFRAQDLLEMVEVLHVAMRCLALFPEDRPKMSDVVLMLENIASLSDGKPQQAQNNYHTDEKQRVWNRIFPLERIERLFNFVCLCIYIVRS